MLLEIAVVEDLDFSILLPFRDRASALHRHWGMKPDGGLSGNKDSRKL